MKNVVKLLYVNIAKRLPHTLVERFQALPINPFILLERWEIRQAIASGPPYRPSHQNIIIDITTSCDLRCVDCNRSCGRGQALSNEKMSLAQIERFVRESVDQHRKWGEISIEGGEPTLHTHLREIVDFLLDYKEAYSPLTSIKILTNGYGGRGKEVLPCLLRKGIYIYNSGKNSIDQEKHCAFNIAPCDVQEFQNQDFSRGCYLPACYGLGLTRYGYYPHPICGNIDRVFGFDMGRKSLPRPDDPMTDQFERLCGLCGFFRYAFGVTSRRTGLSAESEPKGSMSLTWQRAYSRYRASKPILQEYG